MRVQSGIEEWGMEKGLVSVLMVNYNHEGTIAETIESVLRQSYQNVQFIIVDDGSVDRSCEIIKSYSDKRIELYHLEKNRHICYATNYGFKKVKGEYLARIDSDDVWYPEKLEKQIKFLESNTDRKVCFSWIDLIDDNGKDINKEYSELQALFNTRFTGRRIVFTHFILSATACLILLC
ncbi:MAG: glycosyltransferase family 2 protein [Muricomes sp.]